MEISKFTGKQHLEVNVHDYEAGRLVCIRQRGQSMSFEMDMTPKEARKFAQGLLRYADIAEDKNEAN